MVNDLKPYRTLAWWLPLLAKGILKWSLVVANITWQVFSAPSDDDVPTVRLPLPPSVGLWPWLWRGWRTWPMVCANGCAADIQGRLGSEGAIPSPLFLSLSLGYRIFPWTSQGI